MAPGYRRANLTAYFSILSITWLKMEENKTTTESDLFFFLCFAVVSSYQMTGPVRLFFTIVVVKDPSFPSPSFSPPRKRMMFFFLFLFPKSFLIYNPEGFFIHMYEKFYGINGGWGGEQVGSGGGKMFSGSFLPSRRITGRGVCAGARCRVQSATVKPD